MKEHFGFKVPKWLAYFMWGWLCAVIGGVIGVTCTASAEGEYKEGCFLHAIYKPRSELSEPCRRTDKCEANRCTLLGSNLRTCTDVDCGPICPDEVDYYIRLCGERVEVPAEGGEEPDAP